MLVDGGKQSVGQLVLFQQMAEVQQGGFVRDGVQGEAGELAHGGDLVQAFFHGGIGQAVPVLQAVDAQHGGQRVGAATVARLGIHWIDDGFELRPRHDLIHLCQKDFAGGCASS